MRTDTPQTVYLKDYAPYPYSIESVDLNFDIHEGYTTVTATSQYQRQDSLSENIVLHGEDLGLVSVKIDGEDVTEYTVTDTNMSIPCTSDTFTLEIVTTIYPEKNTRLEGLYMSGGNYCTQCEAEGFRRITYFPDRPDVMTTYTVRIEADKSYPVLLSNGNRVDGDEVGDSRHYTIWHDPFPKPCYLFALVAGDLEHIHDTFTTTSGKEVDLYIYVRKGDEDQCAHAMDSLKRSMTWDEDVYGLEYDLELFNIVAVSDFNMGAMENKSLNIFNTALVLAQQDTATDQDFMRVESVIAHEYFHNWSGNRVTCRDWFQLSLKEGLTVFRDQEFSADTHSKDVQRIDDVSHLRRFQFAEDSSPLAHPIRPENYIEINNFYTMTIYEKGAEVIRMIRTILGDEGYRKATDLYFERHDGDAATCEDFVKAMEDSSGIDLTQFRLWYSQAGTPELTFKDHYDADQQEYTITLSQATPPTAGQYSKKPMVLPIKCGLLRADGTDILDTQTLMLTQAEQSFTFDAIPEKPTPSILRNFSAPIKVKHTLSVGDLAFLMRHDSDGFNQWEAAQTLALRVVRDIMAGRMQSLAIFVDSIGDILQNAMADGADDALISRIITLPDVNYIGQFEKVCDPSAIQMALNTVKDAIYDTHKASLTSLYAKLTQDNAFSITSEAMGRRALVGRIVYYLNDITLSAAHYAHANNMTDRMNALAILKNHPQDDQARGIIAGFYEQYKAYPLVVDKWFALQAAATHEDVISHINTLSQHDDFNIKNPNRVRSLYAAFGMNNPVAFHSPDGAGYTVLKDAIIQLNDINPQIAARLLTPFRSWRHYTPDRQEKMKAALSDILNIPNIAPDIFEIASKSLHD